MKIIVVGCGKIGSAIVARLADEGHDVTVVDIDQSAINDLTNLYDVMCVCGNGAVDETLREAGADSCRLFIATTASDELNMLACFIARRMGAKHTVARIRAPEYNGDGLDFLCKELHLSMSVNPDRMCAEEICNILKFPSAANIEKFSGRFQLVELMLDESPAIGLSLAELRRRYPAHFLVCAVQRDNNMFIPSGNFVMSSGDRIALTSEPSEIHKLLRGLGLLKKPASNVMIVGASKIAFYLSKMLSACGIKVKIIEIDRRRCEEFATECRDNSIMVINGDGARQDILEEEGISSMDGFVALSGSDEQNILLSIYAANRGVSTVIPKINRPEFLSMASKLGLDSVVSPANIVVNEFSRYARALDNSSGNCVEVLYRIMDGKAEVIEFRVDADFPYANKPFKDLKIRQNILIAGIVRGKKAIIPDGNSVIMPEDRVIVLSSGHRLGNLTDIVIPEEGGEKS